MFSTLPKNCWEERFLCGPCQGYVWSRLCVKQLGAGRGGGFEYLQHSPAGNEQNGSQSWATLFFGGTNTETWPTRLGGVSNMAMSTENRTRE
jgi:hypothetical protein